MRQVDRRTMGPCGSRLLGPCRARLPSRAGLLSCALVLLATACYDQREAGLGDTDWIGPGTDVQDAVSEETPGVDAAADPAPESADAVACRVLLLLHDTSAPIPVHLGDSFAISVQVQDPATSGGAPAAGIRVQFDLAVAAGSPASCGTPMPSTDPVITGDQGIATALFYTGDVPDCVFTVTVSLPDDPCPSGPPSGSLQLKITTSTCGCVNVSLNYEGGLQGLHDVKVSVLPADDTCDKLQPEQPLPGTPLAQVTLADLSSTPTFDCLPPDGYYSLFVTAAGPTVNGYPTCLAASGCNDSIYLPPGTCVDRNVYLYLVALDPDGPYDAVDHLDLSMLSPGVVDPIECAGGTDSRVDLWFYCLVYQLDAFFAQPEALFASTVATQAQQAGGPWATMDATQAAALQAAFSQATSAWLAGGAPAWVAGLPQAVTDLSAILSDVELDSQLVVGPLATSTFAATQDVTGLTLSWQGVPHAFTWTQLTQAPDPMTLDDAQVTGWLADYDKLIEDLHTVHLNPARLVLFTLDEVVLKTATGGQADTVAATLKAMFDCGAIAQDVHGQIASWFPGTVQDVQARCDAGVAALGLLGAYVPSPLAGSTLSVEGSAVVIDGDCDLKVDRITKGVYAGHVMTGGVEGAAITGTFEATKQTAGAP